MSNLPIYDILYNSSLDKDLSDSEKEEFIKIIKKIDLEGSEILYAIIRVFQVNHMDHCNNVPYSGKILKSGIKFDLDDFPNKLKQMLFSFVKKHVQKMTEDNQRNL